MLELRLRELRLSARPLSIIAEYGRVSNSINASDKSEKINKILSAAAFASGLCMNLIIKLLKTIELMDLGIINFVLCNSC